MATRKTSKGKTAGRTVRKAVGSAKRTGRSTTRADRSPGRGGAKRTPKQARRTSSAAPRSRKVRPGFIAHTELASADPDATKTWCQQVLGWKFQDPISSPSGPYHMWSFGENTGGGIRLNNPPEPPGAIPYCETKDLRSTYGKALAAGAKEMLAPMEIPGGMGAIAIVQAPGGIAIGFWASSMGGGRGD